MGIFDSYNFDWSYGGSPIGDAIGDYMTGNTGSDYSVVGDAINNYVTSGDAASTINGMFGNIPWGKAFNVLGRLGSGIGSFMAGRDVNKQQDYIPYTRWLGNGLAQTGYINNTANKQNKLNRAYDLSNLFAGTLDKYKLSGDNSESDIYNTEDLYGDSNYSAIGNAINNYVRL